MRSHFTSAVTCFASALILMLSQGQAVAQEMPDGYRGEPYKAPTPWEAPGATTLYFAEELQSLIASSTIVLVNVSPVTLGPADDTGNRTWILRRGKTVMNIPGSTWLPNVGYQTLTPGMQQYLENNLSTLTSNKRSTPVLFYCTADCWMSWNTVKRASEELGYTNVYWYPYGVDGWKEAGLELEPAEPVPFKTQ